MRLPALALALALALAGPATAFTAQNGLIVRDEGAGDFVVPWRGRSGAADFWCAAGDYGVRALHLPPSTRIYRASEPPRRAGDGVRFTLDPARAASSTGLAFVWPKTAGLGVGAAQSFCEGARARR